MKFKVPRRGPRYLNGAPDTVGVSRANPEEYDAWKNMWQRCTNPNNPAYIEYKSRRPPEEWRDFKVFFEHVGSRPSPKHSLDRIKNELPYGPGNVRWATKKVQANNTSRTIYLSDGMEVRPLFEWTEIKSVKRDTLRKNPSKYGLKLVLQLHSAP